MDTDLLTHRECGAILCAMCLLASSEHSSQGDHIQCPVRGGEGKGEGEGREGDRVGVGGIGLGRGREGIVQ